MSRKSATFPRIRVTPELKGKVERLALDDNRTVSDYLRLAIEQHVRSVECLRELTSVPVSRFEKYQLGDKVTVTIDDCEISKKIGSVE